MIGTDPELFLYSEPMNIFVPSCGLIGGNKGDAKPCGRFGGVLEDNVTVEFNVSPARNAKQLQNKLLDVLGEFQKTLDELNLTVCAVSMANFIDDVMHHPKSKEFGCAPDYDAYAGAKRDTIKSDDLGNTRFAGGHIHISPGHSELNIMEQVMLCDLYIGLHCVSRYSPTGRAKYYGLPGLYRPTSYGLEYRTPPNEWMQSPEDILAIFEATTICRERIQKETKKGLDSLPIAEARLAIINWDPSEAKKILSRL